MFTSLEQKSPDVTSQQEHEGRNFEELLDSECGILSESLLKAIVLVRSPHFFRLFLQELQLTDDWVNAKGIPTPNISRGPGRRKEGVTIV